MNRFSIKLLVALVFLILTATTAVMTSQAEARGLLGPGASSHLSATRPGVDLASGDPDAGSGGIAPQPSTNQKKLRELREGRGWLGGGMAEWVQWTGRIWATLYLRPTR